MSCPPVPPRRNTSSIKTMNSTNPSNDQEDQDPAKPMSIADRIANLQLNKVSRAPVDLRPPLPVRKASTSDKRLDVRDMLSRRVGPRCPTQEELEARGSAFMQSIMRPVPSPYAEPEVELDEPEQEQEQEQEPPAFKRRLPPLPTRLPTPPPEPEPIPLTELDQTEETTNTSCLMCHDFTFVDEHAANFPRESVSSLDELAYELTSPWGSETEKFRAIFTWLHYNIAYDTQAFFCGNIQPSTGESTLHSGLAVCDGYAGLFKDLSERAGLEVRKVVGHGKGLGYTAVGPNAAVPPFEMNHAWNCISMDGEWHLVDSCWGAGAVDGMEYTQRLAPMWFTSPPHVFGQRHFPEDPSYQLMGDHGLSWEEYILVPESPTMFGAFYSHLFAPDSVYPVEKEIQSGMWVAFQITKICEHLPRDEAESYVYFVNTQDNTRTPLVVNEYGAWSADVYIPSGTGDVSIFYVDTFDSRPAKGLSVAAFQKGVGRKPMTFQGIARWTAV